MEAKKVVADLPESSNTFWEHANTEIHDIAEEERGCDHYFYHRTAQEVECRNCNIGFYLDNYSEVIDGHIYRDEEFVI